MNNIKKYKFLIAFFCLMLLAQLSHRYHVGFSNEEPNIHNFEVSLTHKEQLAEQYIDTLLYLIHRNELAGFVNDNSKALDWLFEEYGIVLYAWDDVELLYWTSNSIALSDQIVKEGSGFKALENAFVELRGKQIGDIHVKALIIIKYEYPYENEYLNNDFHASFKVRSNTLIEKSEIEENAIYTKEGDFLFSIVNDGLNKSKPNYLSLVLFILGLFFGLAFVRRYYFREHFSHLKFALFIVVVVLVRVLMQWFNWPGFLYQYPIFSTNNFQSFFLFPSLGELLVSTLFAVYLAFVYYTKTTGLLSLSKHKYWPWLFLIIRLLIIVIYSAISIYIFNELINNPNIQLEAYDVLNLSIGSFIGYFILILLYIGLILLIDKAIGQARSLFKAKTLYIANTLILLVLTGIAMMLCNVTEIIPVLFLVFLVNFWTYIRYAQKAGLGSIFLLIVFFSIFSTGLIRSKNYKHRIEDSKQMAYNLAREQDPVVEDILDENIPAMFNDSIVVAYLEADWFDYDALVNYLRGEYFSGYLTGYDFQLTVCNAFDSVLVDEESNVWYHCYDFFNELLKEEGVPTSVEGLYYLKDALGSINYFIQAPILKSDSVHEVSLFFELVSKPNFEVLGYPKLLLQQGADEKQNTKTLNYAKYYNGKLLSSTGTFPYAFESVVYGEPESAYAFFQSDGFDHLLYTGETGLTIIVSHSSVHFFNILISFTYILIFFLLQVTLVIILMNRFAHIINIRLTIKNRIVFSMVLILFMSLLIIGLGTVYYTLNQFDDHQYSLMGEKAKSVLVELEHKLSDVQTLEEISPEYLNALLIKFSNVFYTDINLYDLHGNLVATSRDQIFKRKLLSKKMNAVAYRELVLNKKARIVQKEKVGNLDYYSSYVPFMTSDNKLLAYLNLPYFSKEVVLRQEILKIVVAVINIYALLMLLSVIVAIYISNRVTAPLRIVQQRFSEIGIGKKNEIIDYQGKDEIGDLVMEYNRMLGELSQSAELLAKSERETAWREMAKQIAHEIKNPLTPMKLSVQLLERSLYNNDDDFEDRFRKVSSTLIEQIDSLSSIATAFSQFARMPHAQVGKVNVIDRVKQSVELFKGQSDVDIVVNYPNKDILYVNADNERILQVFNNLIKNARQAIDKDVAGEIVIDFMEREENLIVEVRDNGVGVNPAMEDKLFQPNFTTKSSGAGLGLAIVKNIVEEFGGEIWFHSSLGKGTSFFISFPLFIEE